MEDRLGIAGIDDYRFRRHLIVEQIDTIVGESAQCYYLHIIPASRREIEARGQRSLPAGICLAVFKLLRPQPRRGQQRIAGGNPGFVGSGPR
jgi:hypothetical protein